jgi:hypothetical protein
MLDLDSTVGFPALDEALPGSSSVLRQKLQGWVGDDPLSEFLVGQLMEELEARPYQSEVPKVPLISLPEYDDVGVVANRLIADFETLPWEYHAFVSVPGSVSTLLASALDDEKSDRSQRFGLVKLGERASEYPPGPEPVFPLIGKPYELSPDTLYVRGILSGYVRRYFTTTPLEQFLFTVKAFFGFCIAHRFVTRGFHFFATAPKKHALLYRRRTDIWVAQEPHELEADLARTLSSLAANSEFSKHPAEFQRAYMKDFLRSVGHVLTDTEANERLLLAAQWLFDSHSTGSQLLSFIQATVVLETLLGEKAVSDIIGLGELLANRCAYLIGKSKTQRDEVINDFRRIYGTRSSIVHRGHNRLTSDEQRDLFTLRWMCYRVVQEELKLLTADKKDAP